MSESQRTVVICADHAGMYERLVENSGYSVVGVAEVAVHAEHLVRHFTPDMIVVENELQGLTGVESLPNLRAASPHSQIVLVVADDWQPSNIGDIGAYTVLRRTRLSELEHELDALDHWLADQQAHAGSRPERRSGRDRRQRQEWAKVGFEKRGGADRRDTSQV